MTLEDYLTRLASGDAVPGGGAAVAVTAAQGAALLAMVVAVSGKGTPESTAGGRQALTLKLTKAREKFLALATEDGKVFSAVMEVYKLPTGTDAEKKARKAKLQAALKGAAEVPLTMLKELKELFPIMETVAASAKPSIASDAALAVQLIDAAVKGARYNVRINLKYLDDSPFRQEAARALKDLTTGRRDLRKTLIKKLLAHF